MRIIAGSRRGAALTKLDAVNTRPTADRVRESLFNILQGGRFGRLLKDCHVIDLFVGRLGSTQIARLVYQAAQFIAHRAQPRPQGVVAHFVLRIFKGVQHMLFAAADLRHDVFVDAEARVDSFSPNPSSMLVAVVSGPHLEHLGSV